MLKIKEIRAKSVLNKSKIFDYCLNPYTGCQIKCTYCYASLFMRRYSGHSEAWGEFVDAKTNAPSVLKKQLEKARKGVVWISSVCDPYQPLEAKYALTRRCLEELVGKKFPVKVQTKSKLVLRDLDLFREFDDIEVGFSVTTDEERVAKLFEPGASSIKDRLASLRRLRTKGIRTFAFVGPILPGDPENIVAALDGRVDRVVIDRMNYVYAVKRFYGELGFWREMTDGFFNEFKERLVAELRKRKMAFEAVF